MCSVILIKAGFIIHKFQWASIFSRIDHSLAMLIKSLFEIFGIACVEFPIFLASKHISVKHGMLQTI